MTTTPVLPRSFPPRRWFARRLARTRPPSRAKPRVRWNTRANTTRPTRPRPPAAAKPAAAKSDKMDKTDKAGAMTPATTPA